MLEYPKWLIYKAIINTKLSDIQAQLDSLIWDASNLLPGINGSSVIKNFRWSFCIFPYQTLSPPTRYSLYLQKFWCRFINSNEEFNTAIRKVSIHNTRCFASQWHRSSFKLFSVFVCCLFRFLTQLESIIHCVISAFMHIYAIYSRVHFEIFLRQG